MIAREMDRPTPAQMEKARLLLAHEGASASAHDYATAAGQVYDKLYAHLAPLIGSAGIEALLVRSARIALRGFSLEDVAPLEASTKLREWLRGQEPAVAAESAAALFGTFVALITTFIGARLTTQVLRGAWPAIEETAVTERRK
jgi:hypothetical protein